MIVSTPTGSLTSAPYGAVLWNACRASSASAPMASMSRAAPPRSSSLAASSAAAARSVLRPKPSHAAGRASSCESSPSEGTTSRPASAAYLACSSAMRASSASFSAISRCCSAVAAATCGRMCQCPLRCMCMAMQSSGSTHHLPQILHRLLQRCCVSTHVCVEPAQLSRSHAAEEACELDLPGLAVPQQCLQAGG